MATHNIFGREVPQWASMTAIVVLLIIGVLIGFIGGTRGGTTIDVNATVSPDRVGLTPGETRTVSIVVENPEGHGLRVTSISPSSSEAIEAEPEGAPGCPEGVLTSGPVDQPSGYLAPEGSNAYGIPVTMSDNVAEHCQNRAFTLPLEVETSRR